MDDSNHTKFNSCNQTLLTPNEVLRYSRHFSLIGVDGQESLKQAKVLCVGAGGLGCSVLQYLVAVGVGTLGVIDHDHVSISNLTRQILFTEDDIGKLKVSVAKERLTALNSSVCLNVYPKRLEKNTTELITQYDIIIDASDNYKTRYLINDACFLLKKPLVSASIFQFQGQISIFNYQDGPCYRCLYPEPPHPELAFNCDTNGVIGVLPGLIGTIQATEVIKIILNKGKLLSKRLLQVDALLMQIKELVIQKNPYCRLCHHGELSDHLFEREAVQNHSFSEIEPQQLAAWINDPNLTIDLIDVREDFERKICHIGGKHIPSKQFKISEITSDKKKTVVVYCKTGSRSLKIVKRLREEGFLEIYSLKRGLIGWIEEIDPNLLRY